MGRYHRPDNLKDAIEALANQGVTIAAGCTDLFAETELPALDGDVLDITNVAELRGVTRKDGWWRIGATTSWSQIAQAALPESFAMLQEAARQVGGPQIQSRGTIGGNLCTASPAADGVPPLLSLDAQVEVASGEGLRRLPLQEFLAGPRQTALRQDEMLTAVLVPEGAALGRSVFLKLGSRAHLVISVVMVAARLSCEAGRVTHAAVSVGACGPVAVRLRDLETALVGAQLSDVPALVALHMPGVLNPIDDMRGSADYRRHAAQELVNRAASQLMEVAEDA